MFEGMAIVSSFGTLVDVYAFTIHTLVPVRACGVAAARRWFLSCCWRFSSCLAGSFLSADTFIASRIAVVETTVFVIGAVMVSTSSRNAWGVTLLAIEKEVISIPGIVVLELAVFSDASCIMFGSSRCKRAPASFFRSIEPAATRLPSELPTVIAAVSVFTVNESISDAFRSAPVRTDLSTAAKFSFWTLFACCESAVFILAVEAIIEAVTKFVLKEWSNHTNFISVQTSCLWLHRVSERFIVFTVQVPSLLCICCRQEGMRIVAFSGKKRKSSVHDIGSGLERMSGVNPRRDVDVSGTLAI